ncbi:MAG: hypothetical protein PHS92_00455 [Candidatus Gracilibacteria bacterium]|nr:hypothetical protein [Candidatus Gracilibacteria bacterium]
MIYLLNLLSLVVIGFTFIIQYYKVGFHNESSAGYSVYFSAVLVSYVIYKIIKLKVNKQKVSFSPAGMLGYFLLHLLILCIVYFNIIETGGSIILFTKIVSYLFLPIAITLISYSFSQKMLDMIPSFNKEDSSFRFLISLGLGFTLFLTSVVIFGSMGFYNAWAVFGILTVFGIISYKEIYSNIKLFFTKRFEIDNHDFNSDITRQINLYLLSTEFLYIFMTFLIGVAFINIVRPMPIGWDDLGAYMNFPKIMAYNGEILKGTSIMAWQTLTGIGFMFNSAPQAFFLNQIGGILSIIVIILSLGSLTRTNKKTFINLPFLGAAMFYAMPMVIFEQAKDMKLDPGLFFISVISIYGMIHLFLKYLGYEEEEFSTAKKDMIYENEGNGIFSLVFSKIKSVFKSESGDSKLFEKKDYLILLLIIGIITGFAFTIKFTSLMLILGLIGIIFYAKLGFSGFLGYFFLFLGVFTKLRLWDYLNINYPKENVSLINNISYGTIFIALALFIYTFYKYKIESFKKAFLLTLVFVFGIFLAVSPWLIKNSIESYPDINIGSILNGKIKLNYGDYSKIYSSEELLKINQKNVFQATTSSGKTQNEDLGRYFGYEDGINNYLKLPYNLTMQRNQAGEYTEITYIFLALIPIIFLFLFYKSIWGSIGIFLAILLELMYFVIPLSGDKITLFFATQNLPFGYLYIILAFLIPLAYFLYSLKNDKLSQVFKLNMVFSTLYGLIFVIAAYGIVWYGIAIYFSFILMIIIAGSYMTQQEKDAGDNLIKFFGSIVFFGIIGFYFMNSSIPHGFNNLKAAGFETFKNGTINQEEGIFNSHPDYFAILGELNIKDHKKLVNDELSSIKNDILKKIISSNLGEDRSIGRLEFILKQIDSADLSKLNIDNNAQLSIRNEANLILNDLYKNVLYPPSDNQNTAGIYRIGTFLTYFISNNRTRYLDDSLIFDFDKYYYDENPEKTIDRMKKMGLNYLLVDLNAATIDKDPRHDLTRRFENLLKTFKSSRLELVQTDSICLKIALEERNENYMMIGGVNYESYTSSGEMNRGQKQLACYNHILDLLKNNKVNESSYNYLLPLAGYIERNKPKDQNEYLQIFQTYVSHGWLALFKIK